MRLLSQLTSIVLVLALTGCGINFYSGRPTDVERISALSAELEALRRQKESEAQQLRDAQASLAEQLKSEIANQDVKLEMAERGLVLTFVDEVLFDSGRAQLRGPAENTLTKVASVIQDKVADRDVGVEGHTDNEPITHSGWKSNWELSTSRATSVLHFLVEQGVNPKRLVASGYGEYRPVADNSTADGRQMNRRVEIVILPKKLTKRQRDLLQEAAASAEPAVAEQVQALEIYK